ncbi:winged helix DNA-binding domain-containing protein [Streptomyces sp. IBSBF 2435]|uniref:winged helix DNA-binding domain-containing protein n=1 Tax=Streptomyces sp. IBSBF 2435 TaxID=2903531 RepID=UPI002FDC251F
MVNQPLALRTLNRTLLDRQLLLERADMGAEAAVAHLLGLQSQTPTSPYPGLWTRLAGFDFADLGRLLTERRAVRVVLMRNTVHLVTAADALRLRHWLGPLLERAFRGSQWARGAAGAEPAAVIAHGRALLREQPRTPAELRTEFAARFPGADPASLVNALRSWVPLVQLPPRGVWGAGRPPVYGLLEDWLGQPLTAPDPADLVRRYLAAFGPATPADMQKWCGLTGLKAVFAGMDLRACTAEDGRVLYDLPDAVLTDPSVPVTARFVGDFDNLVLSHADRTRIVPEAFRSRVMTVNGIVRGVILVDGFAGGTWRFDRAKGAAAVAVTHFAPLSAADRAALTAEGLRLLAAADPGAAHGVTFTAG